MVLLLEMAVSEARAAMAIAITSVSAKATSTGLCAELREPGEHHVRVYIENDAICREAEIARTHRSLPDR